jgi:hypothetical protein
MFELAISQCECFMQRIAELSVEIFQVFILHLLTLQPQTF